MWLQTESPVYGLTSCLYGSTSGSLAVNRVANSLHQSSRAQLTVIMHPCHICEGAEATGAQITLLLLAGMKAERHSEEPIDIMRPHNARRASPLDRQEPLPTTSPFRYSHSSAGEYNDTMENRDNLAQNRIHIVTYNMDTKELSTLHFSNITVFLLVSVSGVSWYFVNGT